MSNAVNYQSALDQMRGFGLLVDALEVGRATTKRVKVDIAKCPVDKEKSRSAGWYKLNSFSLKGEDYIVGSFGYWKGSDNNAQKIEWKKEWVDTLTPEQRKAMADAHRASIKKAEENRKREIERSAKEANYAWHKYVADGVSPYLIRKQVGAFGVKFDPFGKGTMAIPVMDVKGNIYALQIIRSNLPKDSKKREKDFFPYGAAIGGHFHVIGTLSNAKTIFISEGYATGASIHIATGMPVVVAFNANNLTPVTKAVAAAHKYAQIVICADDDYLTDGNPGVALAQNAALSVGGEWVKPSFMVAGVDIRNSEKLTDFNDLHVHPQGGLHLVTAQLSQYVGQTQPQPKTATVAGGAQTGEGESSSARATLSIEEITARFVYVDDAFGDHAFDREKKTLVKLKKVQAMLPPHVRWDQVKGLPTWRAVHDYEIGFDPTEKDSRVKLNTFTGWKLQPKEGNCSNLLNLLKSLCSAEEQSEELFVWIVRWLAYPLQHPGAKMKSCLVVHGPQGTGKNLFFEAYAEIFGEYTETISQAALEDKFNSDWAARKIFIIANEVVASTERYHLKNQLKGIITDKKTRINPKNLPAYSESNHMNLVFLSNEHQPVVLENDDRRHCIIWTPPAKDAAFYDAVAEERDNGGIEALYWYLLNINLGDFKPDTKPPMTLSKEQLMLLGSDNVQIFFEEWKGGLLNAPVCACKTSDLYDFYRGWCIKVGTRSREQKFFSAYVEKLNGWQIAIRKIYLEKGDHVKKSVRVIVPPIEYCLAAQDNGAEIITMTESETQSEWLKRCINRFNSVSVRDDN
jgi:putative DNA primase/helicase